MRVHLTGPILAAALSLAPGLAGALESPHDREDTNTACYYCHTLTVKSPTGGYEFSQQCISCHNTRGTGFGLPWSGSDEAVPGTTGNSHNWSRAANNPRYGSSTAYMDSVTMSKLVDGRLQCVACHDPHRNQVAVKSSSMHASLPVGVAKPNTGTFNTDTTGTGTLTLTAPEGTPARGFRVRIRSVTANGGTFVMSHDFGWNPNSWLNWNGTAWVAGTLEGPARGFTNGSTDAANVALDLPGVFVRFGSGFKADDYWDFYIGYPMLRQSNVGGGGCVLCHRERAMNHARARGTDRSYLPNGVRKFSHPVGVGLNVNGFGTDRPRVLDADGTAVTDIEGKVGTSGSDGFDDKANATNDLILEGGVVQCTTCHRVHNADSNSLSRDAR